MNKIDSGIPIPGRKGRPEKWPFSKLKVGQSFLARGLEVEEFSGTVSAAKKRLKIGLTMRTVPGGVRVWRVK